MAVKTICDYCNFEIQEDETELSLNIRRNMLGGSASKDIHEECLTESMTEQEVAEFVRAIAYEAEKEEDSK